MNCMRGPLEAEKYEFDLCKHKQMRGVVEEETEKKKEKKNQ